LNIPSLIAAQHNFFRTQQTKDVSFRKKTLRHLKIEVQKREHEIYKALKLDFNKPEFESFLSEFGLVISALDLVLSRVDRWSRTERIPSSMRTFPSRDYIYKEPYGTVLVLAPWNYPFLLSMEPLIMAVAAGNTVVLKPSELTRHTSRLVTEIIETVFNKEHVVSVEGGISVATELLSQRWDYIFFTGSVAVGKIVAKAAAEHLTPVTLELGGKSPCIIDDSVKLDLIARRLVWGKFLNAGQTCISPDYLVVKADIKEALIEAIKHQIIRAYGEDPEKSEDLPRIINSKNTERLINLFEDSNVVYGGNFNRADSYIAPTVIDEPSLDSKVMNEEIFGPILPVLSYQTEKDIDNIIDSLENPLSLYVFSNRRTFVERMLKRYSFGGGAVNDPLIHFGNHRLPFGGVGHSGMGAYHGKAGFDTFTHHKSISKRSNWTDPPVRYAPYKNKLKWIKLFFKYF
jgi:aldehyde dehydrogenase (NAD+)